MYIIEKVIHWTKIWYAERRKLDEEMKFPMETIVLDIRTIDAEEEDQQWMFRGYCEILSYCGPTTVCTYQSSLKSIP